MRQSSVYKRNDSGVVLCLDHESIQVDPQAVKKRIARKKAARATKALEGGAVSELLSLKSVQICILQPPSAPSELTQGVLQVLATTTSDGVSYTLLQLGDTFLYPLVGQEVMLCDDHSISLVLPDLDLDEDGSENDECFFGLTASNGDAWQELVSLVERDCTLSRSSEPKTFKAADTVSRGIERSSEMVAGAVLYTATGFGSGLMKASKFVTDEKNWVKPTKEPMKISDKTKGRISEAHGASEGAKVSMHTTTDKENTTLTRVITI
jgi:hypothetical protein